MHYAEIADIYEKIEATTKRLEMTDLLVQLVKKTPRDLIDRVVYLTQGKLYPDFVNLEIGVAERLAIRALARASGWPEEKIEENIKQSGDIGETAQKFIEMKRQITFFQQPLTVNRVYDTLDKMARATGSGAVDMKTALLAGLLSDAKPKEAKYIMRTVTGSLRLGVADMTVLDALAIAYGGSKEARELIERAYNISSDLGRVARVLAYEGIEGIKRFHVIVGNPIRPMLAERLSSPEEILEKLGGKCIAEYKYDGERVQAHKKGDEVTLFSRRLENITDQYPDAVKLLRTHVKAEEAILEGECVAIDPETGEMQPFQELMHRRRKYGVEKAMEDYPVSLFMFDALYVDGKDLTLEPYPVRRRFLEEVIEESERIKIAKSIITGDVKELETFFLEAIEDGCEGLVCKSIHGDSVYQAGARGWLWIKYKRDYKSEMTDTVDLAVVGAFYGRGKRAGTYGSLLLAAYNPENDTFETVTKCGTGFTDEDLMKLPELMKKHVVEHKHARVNSLIEADVWFEPAVVIEVLGAEITLSPIHTCAMDLVRKGCGLAIRFPRFTGNYRLDKAAEDATTVNEIAEMYQRQLKKIAEV
ncbi:MAG: ATP-dependent DNA ligase [Candidatus Bathyarchaeota archaeon]|nr:ATP-dependent DNA ligase [Candidatus Bathyarchaeota archaeon]MCX8177126.1 ATP-dependent DNA ligase [Candidatus Bathyarchaeota archaeon]MDW8193704.1 ATP-dependent DNA ligase [Nitrososphaerota archaeon]